MLTKDNSRAERKSIKKHLSAIKFIILTFFFIICSNRGISASAAVPDKTGIDVSKYNGVVNWAKVKEQGVDFAMIKTGDGKDTGTPELDIDPQFELNYEEAKKAGIAVGVYHVCTSKTVEEAIREAEYCLQILDGRELEYPIAYDIEMKGTLETGKENVSAMTAAFCETIEEAGYKAMVYSTTRYFNTYFDYDMIKDYPIWVAHYEVEAPSINFPYYMWQFTAKGNIEGAGNHYGYCDINYTYEYISADELILEEKNLTIGKSESSVLDVKMLPLSANEVLGYKSSDPSICKVSKAGKLTGVKAGTATITITSSAGLKEQCKVTVKKAPSKISLASSSVKMTAGGTYQLQWKFPANSFSNQLKFTVSDPSIATVNESGFITAKAKGTATIKVTTFNKKTAKIKIVVS